jgi:hypothetical protein
MAHVRPGIPVGSTHLRIVPAGSVSIRFNLSPPPPPPTGTDYWIGPAGNDTTGDGTYANPWATANKAYPFMLPGNADRLRLKNGTYTNQSLVTRFDGQRPPSGSSSAYTVVLAETDGDVIFDNSFGSNAFGIENTPTSAFNFVKFQGIVFTMQ